MTRPRKPSDTWPDSHDRPRVLVEHADGAVRAMAERYLSREGYQVATCGGPPALGGSFMMLSVKLPGGWTRSSAYFPEPPAPM